MTKNRPPTQRQLRIGEELRHALANILERGEVRDPAVASHVITVTEVRISPDLRNATCYVMPLGGADTDAVLAGLRRASGYLRRELVKAVDIRVAPALHFEADASFDRADRIEAILHRPEVWRDIAGGRAADLPDTGAEPEGGEGD
ncbi:MAG: 30S ribosome-binding factor RbfA [Alphaproteobacteria bacterium]|nr:30S ribosome-binding factor RbfA [Alphaproteobacteria bacterium]